MPTKKPAAPLPSRRHIGEAHQMPAEEPADTRSVDARVRPRSKPARRKGRIGSRAAAARMARTRAMRAAEQERYANRR